MKRWSLSSLLLLIGVSASAPSQLQRVDPETKVPSISVDELVRSVKDGSPPPRIIDVRLREDFDSDPVLIPGAIWRDPNSIDTWEPEIAGDVAVVVYCVRGYWVSQSVTKKLRDMKLNVSQLTGGIEAWKAAGKATASSTR